ncbi:isoprenylcysteine carboxyl methyltransferase family protein [Sediminibacillus albus]|uniref:Methyltransferase n=1 Tax=Sediminibacillus albus TaxID=407036 RepID=A0A1G8VQC3_9BACI|nr:isoprenylcysteine carboxylmethyltransferase family protein [Sediminibacillus albus]SDJ68261.1 methyltransferase [Sediminibacillus albus]
MTLWMWILFLFLIFQRVIELAIARRNEKWMKAQGGIEEGSDHYKWFVITHSLFFVFLLGEAFIRQLNDLPVNQFLLAVFLLSQLFRMWCIASLGKFWNTKIIILPGAELVSKGPYRFIKHPNYLIVLIELIVIPLLFHTYITAIVFPVLHLLLLKIRIPEEEKALARLQ